MENKKTKLKETPLKSSNNLKAKNLIVQTAKKRSGSVQVAQNITAKTTDEKIKETSKKPVTNKENQSVEKLYQDGAVINNAVKKQKRKKVKTVVATTTAILAAGAAVVTPIAVYRKKNEIYQVAVSSEVAGFESYTVKIQRGSTISKLKEKLNFFAGHELIGIYKNRQCTNQYKDGDKVTKDTQVYLKYEKYKYTVTSPDPAFATINYFGQDLSKVEWGTTVNFTINRKSGYEGVAFTVKVNGKALKADDNGVYQIKDIDENKIITIEDVEYLTVSNIPSNVVVTNSNGDVLTSNSQIIKSEDLKFTYVETNGYIMSEFIVNGERVENNATISVDENLEVVYKEVLDCGFTYGPAKYGYEGLEVVNFEETEHPSYDDENLFDIVVPQMILNKPVVGVASLYGSFTNSLTLPEGLKYIDYLDIAGDGGELILPSTIEKINGITCEILTNTEFSQLKEIGKNAFAVSGQIDKLVLPSTLTKIGANPFDGCGINNLVIESELAYNEAQNLNLQGLPGTIHVLKTIVENPNNNHALWSEDTYIKLKTENYYTLYDRYYIESIVVPEGVTEIEEGLFADCVNLREVTLPSTLTKIGAGALQYCISLTEVNLNEGLTQIGFAAFEGAAISSITIPSSVTKISAGAFRDCTKLEKVVIDADLTSIPANTFRNCSKLKEINIPENIQLFGSYAFYNCSSLEKITFTKKFSYLAENALEGCENIKTVQIDGDYLVNEISNVADMFPNVEEVRLSLEIVKDLELDNNASPDICSQFVPFVDTATHTYFTEPWLSSVSRTIPAEAVSVYDVDNTEYDLVSAQHLTIESKTVFDSLKSFALLKGSSYYHSDLTVDIKVPKTFFELDEDGYMIEYHPYFNSTNCLIFEEGDYYIFLRKYRDANYTQFISDGVATYLSTADNKYHTLVCFEYGNQTHVNVQTGCEFIGNSAFANSNIQTITIPESVKAIGALAFAKTKLTTITLPSQIKTLEDGLFADCDLNEVVLNEGLETIQACVFMGAGVKKLIFPSTLKDFGGQDAYASSNVSVFIDHENLYIDTELELGMFCPGRVYVLKTIVDGNTNLEEGRLGYELNNLYIEHWTKSTDKNYKDYYLFTFRY